MDLKGKNGDISNRIVFMTAILTLTVLITELLLDVKEETAVNIFLHDVLNDLEGFFVLVSIFGTPFSFMFIGLIIYWSVDSKIGNRLVLLLITTCGLVESLKMLLHTERPFWVDSEVVVAESQRTTSFGMPSGHSTTPTVFFGMLLHKRSETWKWIIGIFIVILEGLSRLVLGVHSIFQVIGGWMLGLVAVVLFPKFSPKIENWIVSKESKTKIFWSLFFSLLFVVLGIISSIIADGVNISPEWRTNFGEYEDGDFIGRSRLDTILSLSGLLFGWFAGSVLHNSQNFKFEATGTPRQKVIRSIIALPITVLLFVSNPEIDSENISYLLNYLFGVLAGLFATGMAPWIFGKLNLTD